MNPLRIATILTLLLASVFSALANHQPSKEELKKYATSIKAQMLLPKTGLKSGFDKRISFYFSVNACGEIEKVTVICSDPKLKNDLETGFRQINLPGFPVNSLSRIDLHYIVY